MVLVKKTLNVLWLVVALVILGLVVLFITEKIQLTTPLKKVNLLIDQHVLIAAEVAESPAQLYRGLSDRADLCPDCGMLFNFQTGGDKEFIMRQMKFPLDIIFINQGRVVKIAADLPPEGNPPYTIYRSGGSADQVLEVNAGYSRQFGLTVGSVISRVYP